MTDSSPPPRGRLPDADLFVVEDAAVFFGVACAAIRKRIRLGKLGPWTRQGRRLVIRRSSFERWLDEQERNGE